LLQRVLDEHPVSPLEDSLLPQLQPDENTDPCTHGNTDGRIFDKDREHHYGDEKQGNRQERQQVPSQRGQDEARSPHDQSNRCPHEKPADHLQTRLSQINISNPFFPSMERHDLPEREQTHAQSYRGCGTEVPPAQRFPEARQAKRQGHLCHISQSADHQQTKGQKHKGANKNQRRRPQQPHQRDTANTGPKDPRRNTIAPIGQNQVPTQLAHRRFLTSSVCRTSLAHQVAVHGDSIEQRQADAPG
jgi:hypothetical protein